MNHLRARMRLDLCVLLGDLNNTGAPGTPLASALGALGPLSAWHRLVPPATPTNFTTRHGPPRSTAIDHIFATGPIASHTHHVLPCHTSHAMVLAQVTLHHRSCDAHSWCLFRCAWRPSRTWTPSLPPLTWRGASSPFPPPSPTTTSPLTTSSLTNYSHTHPTPPLCYVTWPGSPFPSPPTT